MIQVNSAGERISGRDAAASEPSCFRRVRGDSLSCSDCDYGLTIGIPAEEPVVKAIADVALAIVFLKMYALVAKSTGSCAVPMINLK